MLEGKKAETWSKRRVGRLLSCSHSWQYTVPPLARASKLFMQQISGCAWTAGGEEGNSRWPCKDLALQTYLGLVNSLSIPREKCTLYQKLWLQKIHTNFSWLAVKRLHSFWLHHPQPRVTEQVQPQNPLKHFWQEGKNFRATSYQHFCSNSTAFSFSTGGCFFFSPEKWCIQS